MKKCYKCKKELSLDHFYPNKSKFDGLASECKICGKLRADEYRAATKDKSKERSRNYYLKNKQKIKDNVNIWILKNRVKRRKYSTTAKNKLKQEVFIHYCKESLKCQGCPETNLEVLTIDHIAGNGGKHRRSIQNNGGYNFYRWLKKNNYPEGLVTVVDKSTEI